MPDEDAPATKRDLAQLEERLQNQMREMHGELQEQMRQMRGELQEQMRQMRGELQEQMRDMQTELLRAFQPWQESIHIQFEQLKANTGNTTQATSLRMDIMERRLLEIEKKLRLNPPAA